MSSIRIKDEPQKPVWALDQQITRHNLTPQNSVNPELRLPGINRYGLLEVHFEYGNDMARVYHAGDPDLVDEIDPVTGLKRIVILGITICCPRCLMPMYIRTPASPRKDRVTHHVEIHLNDPWKAGEDGYWRPTFTVDGTFGCDYLTSEATGMTGPRANLRCGWKGGIIRGRALDHR